MFSLENLISLLGDLELVSRTTGRWVLRFLKLYIVRWMAVLLMTALAVSAALPRVLVQVAPGSIGVRVATFGGGVQQRDYRPGTHFSLAGERGWKQLNGRTRFAVFGADQAPPLELRTRDDNPVSLEAVVAFSILEDGAWRLVAEGLEVLHEARVRSIAEGVLRSELALLDSQEWFSTERRMAAVEALMPKLQAELGEVHCRPEYVALHSVRFSKQYEEGLQAEQLEVQNQRRSAASIAAAQAKEELAQSAAEDARSVKEIEARAEGAQTERRAAHQIQMATLRSTATTSISALKSEAEAEYVAAVAEGQRAIGEARAEARANELAVLSGAGGASYLAVKAAAALHIETVVLDPSRADVPSPLDLDALQALITPRP